jgi:protein-S-isoprenylcysteine O-methyltransferase Ste14
MDIWGIGPRIAVSGILSFAATSMIGLKSEHLDYGFAPRAITTLFGIVLVIVGIYFWLDSARLIVTRFKSGVLITEGAYRLVRNPMYAGFIVFIVPGISLLLNNPWIILSSIVMMLVFKMSIHKEEQYLKQQFGTTYEDYKSKVKQIIPFVW